jgi:hypothetical protein
LPLVLPLLPLPGATCVVARSYWQLLSLQPSLQAACCADPESCLVRVLRRAGWPADLDVAAPICSRQQPAGISASHALSPAGILPLHLLLHLLPLRLVCRCRLVCRSPRGSIATGATRKKERAVARCPVSTPNNISPPFVTAASSESYMCAHKQAASAAVNPMCSSAHTCQCCTRPAPAVLLCCRPCWH